MRFGGRGRQPSPAAMEKQRPVPLPACSSTSVGFFASQRNGSPWGSTRKKYARPDPAVRKKMRTAKMTAHRRFSSWLREWQNQTTRCIAYLTHPVCAGITVTFSRGISPHSAADPPKEPAHRSYINCQVEYITPFSELQEVRSDIVNYLTKKYSGGRSRPYATFSRRRRRGLPRSEKTAVLLSAFPEKAADRQQHKADHRRIINRQRDVPQRLRQHPARTSRRPNSRTAAEAAPDVPELQQPRRQTARDITQHEAGGKQRQRQQCRGAQTAVGFRCKLRGDRQATPAVRRSPPQNSRPPSACAAADTPCRPQCRCIWTEIRIFHSRTDPAAAAATARTAPARLFILWVHRHLLSIISLFTTALYSVV